METIPLPMRDELGQGYAGRVAYLLGYSSINALRRAMIGTVPKELQHKYFIATGVYLSQLAGMDPVEYIASHTLTHYRFAFPKLEKRRDGFIDYTRLLLGEHDGPLVDKVEYCPECIAGDLEEFGFSWWRRTHQLPAIEICSTHKTPLKTIDGRGCLGNRHSYLNHSSGNDKTSVRPSASAIVDRFRTFSIWLLNLNEPLNPERLHSALAESMRNQGVSRNFKGKNLINSPSLFVRSSFPSEWLARHYSKLVSEFYSGKDLNFDCILSVQGANGMVLAMLLAALYSGPEELMTHLHASHDKQYKKCAQARTDLLAAYLDNMGDVVKISEQLNISKRFAYKICEDAGLPSMNNSMGCARKDIIKRLRTASAEEIESWRSEMKYRPERRNLRNISSNEKINYFSKLVGVAPIQGELF